ncbi:uncharacterized protein K452DRAFT_312080 [Aplosporella prunicola CBS 121167]|uniref:Uncharacterized protein n=1 Tax=Aplosporella prunicola CBS 121167 TaxID=1176127 RepID=A0A6A6B389_9PEZI|nr:uncharacterized protein K452DRAFT_312080 [Aplosporella prunicola CBS 121167]KAF2137684.1 hypothetical protein K452DRAFT_312080 [Aplosporella prunicola CBS 121167]
MLPLGAPTWEKALGTDAKVTPGKYTCDVSFINKAAEDLMKALPIIGEVGCKLLTSSLNVAFKVEKPSAQIFADPIKSPALRLLRLLSKLTVIADDNVLPKGFDPSKIKNLSKIKKLKGSTKEGNKRFSLLLLESYWSNRSLVVFLQYNLTSLNITKKRTHARP